MRTLIASDWHLGRYSSADTARLAETFLRRALDAGDAVILNGDIFECLFEPADQAEAAHADLSALIARMTSSGQLQRTEGNHDPGTGPAAIVLTHQALGRILVAHGHSVDSIRNSLPGRIGDAVSRRFGWMPLVRRAARLAEVTAGLTLNRVERVFSARCISLVDRATCTFGVFGHIHRSHLSPGDRYVNAGHLTDTRLEFVALTTNEAMLEHLDLSAIESSPARVGEPAGGLSQE